MSLTMNRTAEPTRRQFLGSLSTAAAATAFGAWPAMGADRRDDLPSVLWLVSEDNSPFLGCYGDKQADTPNLDRFASEGVRYELAFAPAPVCAPCRSSIITGMHASSLGTLHMRSNYPIPASLPFFPKLLRGAGYYCTNNAKEDYNTPTPGVVWDASSRETHYKNRGEDQPFFAVFNFGQSHEGRLHNRDEPLRHDPARVDLPPHHPDLPELRSDWARYYDAMQTMDDAVGKALDELEERGLAEDTIVFYYGDHGGAVAGSKRFIYDRGTRVPLIVRFPTKYAHLAPALAGGSVDRPVSLLDLGPTVLSLAGLATPPHMQGHAFLGRHASQPRQYVSLFSGRMDERYDCVRGIRDQQFLYRRNYMPHRIYGQHIHYLWKAKGVRAWQAHYEQGRCDPQQARFWGEKPSEELYDCQADPHHAHNLADDGSHRDVLERMRTANREHLLSVRDAGFLPEAEMVRRAELAGTTIYEMTQAARFPLERIVETAELATTRDGAQVDKLIRRLSDTDSGVRYWAATGCAVLGKAAARAGPALRARRDDDSPSVRVAVAEALVATGDIEAGLALLDAALRHEQGLVVLHAINVVQAIGEQARPVLDTVRKVTHEHGGHVRSAGEWAHETLGEI